MTKIDCTPQEYTSNLIAKIRMLGVGLMSESINQIPFCFSGDGMNVYGRNLGFINDSKFMQSYARALDRFEIQEYRGVLESIIWRKHILCSLARQSLNISGDFVECGVEWGFGVDVVSHYIDFSMADKKWYLYDTFTGVPPEDIDSGFKVSSRMTTSDQCARVKEKFKSVKNISIIQGRLPEAIKDEAPQKIAYLHIDLNNTAAEISTFIKLYDRVSIGGVVIFDDYGALLFEKQFSAESELLTKMGITIAELPTGQAFFIKTKEIEIDGELIETLSDHNFEKNTKSKITINEIKTNRKKPNYEELFTAFEYYKSQLNYISEFINQCEDVEKKNALLAMLEKYSQLDISKSEKNILVYSTFLQFELADIDEARFDLQNKIDYLQGKIDGLQGIV